MSPFAKLLWPLCLFLTFILYTSVSFVSVTFLYVCLQCVLCSVGRLCCDSPLSASHSIKHPFYCIIMSVFTLLSLILTMPINLFGFWLWYTFGSGSSGKNGLSRSPNHHQRSHGLILYWICNPALYRFRDTDSYKLDQKLRTFKHFTR